MSASSRVALAACALVSVGLVAPIAAPVRAVGAQIEAQPLVTGAVGTHADFNGDGYDDLLVAAPGEGTAGADQTGALTVVPGSAKGLAGTRSLTLTPCTPGVPGPCAQNDRWGTTHAVGDFNGDGYADVAVGARQTIGSAVLAGSVTILYGSAQGLTTKGAQLLAGSTVGVPAAQRTLTMFGASLAAGDFDGDGHVDLAIGVPGATLAGRPAAGLVIMLRGSAKGLSTHAVILTPGTGGVAGAPTRNSAFGQVLLADDIDGDHLADLVVGVPNADVGGKVDAGEIYRFWGSKTGVTATSDTVVAGTPATNRQLGLALAGPPGGEIFATARSNGTAAWSVNELTIGRAAPAVMFAAHADTDAGDDYGVTLLGADLGIHFDRSLVIGAPGFDATGKVDAFDHHDIVHVITAATAPAAGPTPEFGLALAAGDFNGDGSPDLVIGEPDATVSGEAGAGQLIVMYSNGVGPDRSQTQVWNQESPGIPSASEAGDEWGWV